MIAFFVLFRPQLFGGSQAMDIWLDAIGLALGLLGQVFRIAVIGFAYIRRGGVNKQVYAENLVTQGFFGVCRNPLYVGNLISIFGFTLIYNNPWVYAIAVPFFLLAYNAIVRAEEDFLRQNLVPSMKPIVVKYRGGGQDGHDCLSLCRGLLLIGAKSF